MNANFLDEDVACLTEKNEQVKKMQSDLLENSVIGKLAAEGLTIESSWPEIEKCLSRVIAKTKCIKTAYYLKYGNQED